MVYLCPECETKLIQEFEDYDSPFWGTESTWYCTECGVYYSEADVTIRRELV